MAVCKTPHLAEFGENLPKSNTDKIQEAHRVAQQ